MTTKNANYLIIHLFIYLYVATSNKLARNYNQTAWQKNYCGLFKSPKPANAAPFLFCNYETLRWKIFLEWDVMVLVSCAFTILREWTFGYSSIRS